jgi:MoxR-like ATPase
MLARENTLRLAIQAAQKGLVGREGLVELLALAAVAGEHVLVIGPPGTAKSEAVRRMAKALGGRYFEYLLGRFTEPTEIFGPVDLARLREGSVEVRTQGMLPEAEIAFLDEVFLGSTAILNTLLGVLNERQFRRGHTVMQCPLRLCIGAANALPEDESLSAFADRFLVRVFVSPMADNQLESLLTAGWALSESTPQVSDLATVDALQAQSRQVDLNGVLPELARAIRLLRGAGIQLSDRRLVRAQRLIAAAATLAGRRIASAADLWPLVHAVPTAEQQILARETLRPLLDLAHNPALLRAAAEASEGIAARAALLAEEAEQALAAADGPVIEALLRRIDAGFDPQALPSALVSVRAALAARLNP